MLNAKEPKIVISQPKKVVVSKDEDNDDSEDEIIETKAKFSTLTNMEDIKRSFCNNDYQTFQNMVSQHPFKFYKAIYKYSSDKPI